MIETLSLQNFKVLRDIDVRLHPFTLLVGPNASGKSTLLQALELLAISVSSPSGDHLSQLFRHSQALLSRIPHGHTILESAGVYFSERFGIRLSLQEGHSFLIGEHGTTAIDFRQDRQIGVGPIAVLTDELMVRQKKMLPAAMLKLDVKKLAAASYPRDVTLVLPNDGEGLSSILAGLHLEHPRRFQHLVDQLKRVVPGVQNVRIKQTPLERRVGFEVLFDMRGADSTPAAAVSDGTLLTLGLLTVLAAPEPPQLVLIDELERGLHPKALGDLVQQLRGLQEQNPELQIVATSHSPYLLDHFKAEEILLTSLDEEGYTAVKPLTDHPEYERWKDLMAPGEFWSTVGESWITEGNSKKATATGR